MTDGKMWRALNAAAVLLGAAALAGDAPAQVILDLKSPTPIHRVSDSFISFALDSSIVLGGADVVSEGVLEQWNNSLLRKVVSLVRGGYIRIGGFYTDYLHYAVPNSNYTRCPLPAPLPCVGPAATIPERGGMCPCYFLLTMERWRETLDFAHATGMKVAFNLNAINGRSQLPGVALKGNGTCGAATASVPPWDATEAEAILVWTRDNIPEEKWPAYWGLGNELTGLIPPQQYAADIGTLQRLVSSVFAGKRRQPSVYAPCGCTGAAWNSKLLAAVKANGTPLGAWSWHAYGHSEMTVASMAEALYGGSLAAIQTSGKIFEQSQKVITNNDSAGSSTESWITESAWSATPPPFNCAPGAGNCTGAAAALDPMLRAGKAAFRVSDTAWLIFTASCAHSRHDLVHRCTWVRCIARRGRVLQRDVDRGLAGDDRVMAAGRRAGPLHAAPFLLGGCPVAQAHGSRGVGGHGQSSTARRATAGAGARIHPLGARGKRVLCLRRHGAAPWDRVGARGPAAATQVPDR